MTESSSHEQLQAALSAEALGALAGPEREALLAHLERCGACRERLEELREAVGALAYAAPPAHLDPERSARIRARLLARARRGGGRSGIGRITAASGWLVAAGLAALLLTHHSFHRPLSLGWVAAAVLGIVLFLVGLYAVAQRREVSALRERLGGRGGHPRRPS